MVIDAFLSAAERAEMVVNRPEIAERWNEPSALDGHTIGSLAAHLARSLFTVQRYLVTTRLSTPIARAHSLLDCTPFPSLG